MAGYSNIHELYKWDVNWDNKFCQKCRKYASSWDYFEGYGEVWDAPSGYGQQMDMKLYILFPTNKRVRVILDKNFNTVDVLSDKDFKKLESVKLGYKSYLESLCNNWYNGANVTLPYPFDKITMSKLMELYSRIKFHDPNHSNKYKMYFDNKIVTDDTYGLYSGLLSYIEFIGSNVEEHFATLYKSKILGYDYPNVYQYVNNIVSLLNEYLKIVTSPNHYLEIYDFLSDLPEFVGAYTSPIRIIEEELKGIPYPERIKWQEKFNSLTKWIPLRAFSFMLLKDKGYEIVRDSQYSCKMKHTKDEWVDLSEHVKDLTTLLTPREFKSVDDARNEKPGKVKINIEEYIKTATGRDEDGPKLRFGVKKPNGEFEKE